MPQEGLGLRSSKSERTAIGLGARLAQTGGQWIRPIYFSFLHEYLRLPMSHFNGWALPKFYAF